MRPAAFEPFAGLLAILVAFASFVYSVAFVILSGTAPGITPFLVSFCLLLVGLMTTGPLVAVYERLNKIEPGFALWAVLLGIGASLGSALHGGFDLANVIHPPSPAAIGPGTPPSEIDPRGLLTFGVAGVAQLVIAWLMTRGSTFPIGLAYLGLLSGVLLIIIYLGRLIILQPSSPGILIPAVIEGFVVNPVWYLWLGVTLLSGRARAIT